MKLNEIEEFGTGQRIELAYSDGQASNLTRHSMNLLHFFF